MQNEAGEYVDMYIPRKCSASNRILSAKDHASIQINLAEVDESTGRMTGGFKTYDYVTEYKLAGDATETVMTPLITGRDRHACGVYRQADGQQVIMILFQK